MILNVVLLLGGPSSYASRHDACKSTLLAQNAAVEKLRAKVASLTISQNIDPFLLISQTWTHFERLKFQKSIAKYTGEAREYFCWMVRLTAHWVNFDANDLDMKIALTNLFIDCPEPSHMKDKLLRFIYNR